MGGRYTTWWPAPASCSRTCSTACASRSWSGAPVAEPSQVTVVIPAFNEEDGIGAVVSGLVAWPWGGGVVGDVSADRGGERAQPPGARVVRHPYNKGNGAAVKTGIREAQGDVILLMD